MNDQIERHFHWILQGYNGPKDAEQVRWLCTIEVIGYQTEEDAIIAARDVITRDNFALYKVYECNTCRYQSQVKDAMRDMVNTLKS